MGFAGVFNYVNSMPRKKKRRSDITDERAIQDAIANMHKTNIKLKKFSFSEKQNALLKILFDKKTNIVFGRNNDVICSMQSTNQLS